MLDVASYRLATHLGLAFVILGCLVWFSWQLHCSEKELVQARRNKENIFIKLTTLLLALAFVQILSGALVAGIDAGRGYIDWPLMNGEFIPSESFDYVPLWSNFFENPALVQFNHRLSGYILILFVLYSWFKFRNSSNQSLKSYSNWVLLAILGQVVLGVITVLYAAVWYIAILHQFSAIILVSLVLLLKFEANYPATQFTKTS